MEDICSSTIHIKNTFVEFTSAEEACGKVIRRNNSCPSLSSDCRTTACDECATTTCEEASVCSPSYVNWADVSCDSDGEDAFLPRPEQPSCPSAPADFTPMLVSPGVRTPLRTPLRSTACAFVSKQVPVADAACVPVACVVVPAADAACVQAPSLSTGQVSSPPTGHAAAAASKQASAAPVPSKTGEATTVMMRNIPCSLTRKMFIHLLNSKGFTGKFDFVYLPIDFSSKFCVGYAFVNLTSERCLTHFTRVFNGFNAWPIKSKKVCVVVPSQTQGLAANIERYRDSPVMGEDVPDSFKPMVFDGKDQIEFPSPTKSLPKVQPRPPVDESKRRF